MPFANEILGGQGALTRPQAKSPNYVPGSTGWAIFRDGSAEFNNITARGTLIVADAVTGTFVRIRNTAGLSIIELQPPNQVGHTFTAGFITASEFAGPNFGPFVEIVSPSIGGGAVTQIGLVGENGGGPATIDFRSTGSGSRVQILDSMELFGGEPFGFLSGTVTLTSGTTTLQNVTGLSVPVQANAFYFLELQLLYFTQAAAQFKFEWSGPAGITYANHRFIGHDGGGVLRYNACAANGGVSGLFGSAVFECVSTWGTIITSAAGTLQLQAAQAIANPGAVQVGAGSYFRLKRFA